MILYKPAYLYTTTDEYGWAKFDICFEDLADAEEFGRECGIYDDDWGHIPDLLEYCTATRYTQFAVKEEIQEIISCLVNMNYGMVLNGLT